jgi:hypothetical protein
MLSDKAEIAKLGYHPSGVEVYLLYLASALHRSRERDTDVEETKGTSKS